jgi:hypothetical protein
VLILLLGLGGGAQSAVTPYGPMMAPLVMAGPGMAYLSFGSHRTTTDYEARIDRRRRDTQALPMQPSGQIPAAGAALIASAACGGGSGWRPAPRPADTSPVPSIGGLAAQPRAGP